VDKVEKRKYESPRQVERQSKILACARDMLSEVGYAGMTMRSLAEKAGVAPATLYNLYGGKDDLILAAVDDLLRALGAEAAEQRESEGIEAILMTARVTARQLQETPRFAEAMARALFRVESDDPLVDVLFARGLPYVAEQLAIARDKGEVLPEVDTELVALHITSQGWSTTIAWMLGMLPLEEVLTERQRSLIMTLIGVTRGAAKRRLEARLKELGWRGHTKTKHEDARSQRREAAV